MEIQRVAAELLDLEKCYQCAEPSDEEVRHWREVAITWLTLARRDGERRRFVRFPHCAKVRVRHRGRTDILEVVEVGSLGLQIKGDLGEKFCDGEPVILEAVHLEGRWVEIEADCRVAHKSSRRSAGLMMPRREQRFYDVLYYPAYLSTLEAMAAGESVDL